QAVEYDLLAIGSDIERSHRRVLLSEMRKLARRFRRHIENPEVLSCWARALHVNETLATGQESYALAGSVRGDVGPFGPCAGGAHGQEGGLAPNVSACIEDDRSVG